MTTIKPTAAQLTDQLIDKMLAPERAQPDLYRDMFVLGLILLAAILLIAILATYAS